MSNSTIGRLRIALVITELGVGGAERTLTNLAIGLNRERFSPTVFSLAPPPPKNHGLLVEKLADSHVPVEFLGMRRSWQFPRAIRSLRHRLSQTLPDLLQSFLFHANIVSARAARHSDLQAVVTGIRVSDPRRWRAWLERAMTKDVDRIVCVSQSVADFSREFARLPNKKLCVIYNGIDAAPLESIKPISLDKLGLNPTRKIIAFAGRLHPQKGLKWLLQTASRFLAALPEHDLLLIGDGPQRRALENQARALRIDDRVRFTGFRQDAREVLAAAQLVVLTSLWEGMPNTLMEAMALEKPIVALRADGVAELLSETDATQLVDTRDSEEFSRRVVRIVRDSGFATSIGKQNRKRIQDHFSLRGMIGAYEKLYISLTAQCSSD